MATDSEVCSLCALRLRSAEVVDDELRIKLVEPTGAAQILAETFATMLDKAGAENYLEVTFFREADNQRYVVTVHRPGGKSPHEKRVEAEHSAEVLAGLLTRISGWDHMDVAEDGPYWRREIAAALSSRRA